MYDPKTGVWLQRDPAQQGNNLYEYCGDNPVNSTDSTGLAKIGPDEDYSPDEKYDLTTEPRPYPKQGVDIALRGSKEGVWYNQLATTVMVNLQQSFVRIQVQQFYGDYVPAVKPIGTTIREPVPKKGIGDIARGTNGQSNDKASLQVWVYSSRTDVDKDGKRHTTRDVTVNSCLDDVGKAIGGAHWLDMKEDTSKAITPKMPIVENADYIFIGMVYTEAIKGTSSDGVVNHPTRIVFGCLMQKNAKGEWKTTMDPDHMVGRAQDEPDRKADRGDVKWAGENTHETQITAYLDPFILGGHDFGVTLERKPGFGNYHGWNLVPTGWGLKDLIRLPTVTSHP